MSAAELLVLRGVLATIWLVTALLCFGIYPVEASLNLLQRLPVDDQTKLGVIYAGAVLDLLMGMLTLAWPRRLLWLAQFSVVAGYTLLSVVLVPGLWLHPFGPLLKNLAVLAVIWLLYRHSRPARSNA